MNLTFFILLNSFSVVREFCNNQFVDILRWHAYLIYRIQNDIVVRLLSQHIVIKPVSSELKIY